MENRLRVAVGAEAMPALFQFPAQFQVIVDLAIENDDGAAIGREISADLRPQCR